MQRTDLIPLVFVNEAQWSQATVEVTELQGGDNQRTQHAGVPHVPAVLKP